MATATLPTVRAGTPLLQDGIRAVNFFNGRLVTSGDMRRDAVARLIEMAAASRADEKTDEAIELYQLALSGAVDDDQVRAIVNLVAGSVVDFVESLGGNQRVGEEVLEPRRQSDIAASAPRAEIGELRVRGSEPE